MTVGLHHLSLLVYAYPPQSRWTWLYHDTDQNQQISDPDGVIASVVTQYFVKNIVKNMVNKCSHEIHMDYVSYFASSMFLWNIFSLSGDVDVKQLTKREGVCGLGYWIMIF